MDYESVASIVRWRAMALRKNGDVSARRGTVDVRDGMRLGT
jgi:hypothetical protein